jgi:hypothetical protein
MLMIDDDPFRYDPLTAERFVVTDDHIRLLREMYVSWYDCEFGAPTVDPKRPYGNSDVIEDMREVLERLEADEDELRELHLSMKLALQILLVNASTGIQPGEYRSECYSSEWRYVGVGDGGGAA